MPDPETTALLVAARGGDDRATDRLFAHLYDELRRLSQAQVNAEPGPITLSATGLVHEAYARLVGTGDWSDRNHFLATASRAMRRILTDRARARTAGKRGGDERPATLDEAALTSETASPDLVLAIDQALTGLAERDRDLARVFELRFFGGLEIREIAQITGASTSTVARQWARAKAYLRADLA